MHLAIHQVFATFHSKYGELEKSLIFFTRCNADDVISIRKLGTQRCAQMGSLQRTYVAISNNRRNNNNWDMDLCSILMVRHFQTLQILWPLTFLISMQWECFSIQWSLNSYSICLTSLIFNIAIFFTNNNFNKIIILWNVYQREDKRTIQVCISRNQNITGCWKMHYFGQDTEMHPSLNFSPFSEVSSDVHLND